MKRPYLSAIDRLLPLIFALVALGGCAYDPNNPDPFQKCNRFFYDFNDTLDRHIVKPASDAYVEVTPQPVRTGVTNFFNNLGTIDTILNGFLQGKPEQGFSDTGRLLLNSTVGVFGILDPATDVGLKKHSADFGQTLGVWGVKPGPYLVLPFFGPSNCRDWTLIPVAVVDHPLFWVDNRWITWPAAGVNAMNARANATGIFQFRNQAAVEPYVFTRESYLRYREKLVRGGPAPAPQLDDLDNFDEPTTKPATNTPAGTK